jgi:hypothetical protein
VGGARGTASGYAVLVLLVLLLGCADGSTCSPAIPVSADEGVLLVRPRVPTLVGTDGRVFVGAYVEGFGVFGADADPSAGCAVLILPAGTYSTWVYAENADGTQCGWADHEDVVVVAGGTVEREPAVTMDECSSDTAATW